ncbi:hypothetical protein NT6N_20510 [Oceaniferula spumae]|uniref:PEP-CTERM protein-sorting domain-containing protein n=1 Tax=Oceaniferula spumae TaxID=2979115 RepID=A0AAT9FM03_9BACT
MKTTNTSPLLATLVGGSLMIASQASATVVATENFDSYTSSSHPSYPTSSELDGQGGWVMSSNGTHIRDDLTNGSLSGNVAYNNSATAGVGYRDDGGPYLSASTTSVVFEMTGRVGNNRFSRAGVGFNDGGTFSQGVLMGAGAASGFIVYLGPSFTAVASSTDGYATAAGANVLGVVDMRLTIDLVNELGTFEYSLNGSTWLTPSGMSDFDMSALNTSATDGTNWLNWDSLSLRSIRSGDITDNLAFSAVPEPSSALLGLIGLSMILRRRR